MAIILYPLVKYKHPLTTDKEDALDHGEWAFDEWVHEKGGISPKGKDFPLNGLPQQKVIDHIIPLDLIGLLQLAMMKLK